VIFTSTFSTGLRRTLPALALAAAGMALSGWIMDEDKMTGVTAKQDIPIGHKVALRDMAVGDTVIKYGIDMGKVVKPISAGEHAHVHNIKTKRW